MNTNIMFQFCGHCLTSLPRWRNQFLFADICFSKIYFVWDTFLL